MSMTVGFCFTQDDYQAVLPTAGGGMDAGGLTTAVKCRTVLLRPYFKGTPQPHDVALKIKNMQTVASAPSAAATTIYYVIGNEPNLPQEQWQGGLAAYETFYNAVRAALPGDLAARCCWAGMSPGGDNPYGWTSAANNHECAAVVVHLYSQTLQGLQHAALDAENACTHNLIAGEVNFGPGPGIKVNKDTWATDVWGPFIDWLRARPRWLMALYFAYSWNSDMQLDTRPDAKGTKIASLTLQKAIEGDVPMPPPVPTPAPQPTPVPPTPTPSVPAPSLVHAPLDRAWWIWYVKNCGGVHGIIDTCWRTGVRNVFIKGGDGPHVWDQVTPDLVNALKAEGLNVYVWHYTYLGWLPGTVHGDSFKWTVQHEIACVADMLNAVGNNVDGFVSDPEAETEGRPDQARDFARAVRGMLGDKFFGYAPLPVIDYHQDLPYVQFNGFADAMMPQFYCKALGGNPPWTLERLMEQWDRWSTAWKTGGLRVPYLMPVTETYDTATIDDVHAFEKQALSRRWSGWSFWSLEHALQTGIVEALAQEHVPVPTPVPTPTPTPTPSTVDQLLQEVAQLQDQFGVLAAAGNDEPARRMAYTLGSAIDAFKYVTGR